MRLGKYELLSKIASGGMAEIYVARDRGRVCVVKKLLPQHADKEEFIQMFLDEGRLAASLVHPNIVRMYEAGTDAGQHYLAMEYLHGEDLRGVMRAARASGRLIPRDIVLAAVMGVCDGLDHAHEARAKDGTPLDIVHRDVSPHNVFLTFDGGVKVVDFGIAMSQGRRTETKHGTLKGKVPYMSPEQIKGKKIDRRSDVYAVGVMLYELLLGRRPYILPTGGEFALMMAIVRNDVRPATTLDPSFPPALDAIVQKAMAYDVRSRYQTLRELRQDLEAYAKRERMRPTTAALSEYLAGLFGARVEAWRAALANEKVLAAHVVEVEEERAQSGILDGDDDDDAPTEVDEASAASSSSSSLPPGRMPPPNASSAALVASTSGAIASVVELFGVTVITLSGRLDESFEGAQLGESLSGTVLFDLAGVERVTSFGVREWLEMMKAIERQGDVDAYLARCSEPVVTQLSLIRGFASPAKVVSFQVPFLCEDCGLSFHRTLDCEQDADVLESQVPPTATCSRCSGNARHDDGPSALAFVGPFLRVAVPEAVRTIVTTLESRSAESSDAVEKHVTNDETRFRIRRDVERNFRWNRVLDGVEGKVVFDFRGVHRMSPETAKTFVRSVLGLGADVTRCTILDCPASLALELGRGAVGGTIDVPHVCFEARCTACAAQRSGRATLAAMRKAHDEGRPVVVPCARCHAPLEAPEAEEVAEAIFTPEGTAVFRSSHPAPPPTAFAAPPAAVERPERAPRPAGARRSRLYVPTVAAAGFLVVGLAFVAARRAEQPATAAAPPPSTSSSATAPAESATAEVVDEEPGIRREGGVVRVVVSGRGATDDEALAAARASATAALLDALEEELPANVRAANASLPKKTGEDVFERFDRDVGTYARPERLSVRSRGRGAPLSVTYGIDEPAWKRAREHYAATEKRGGVVFGRVFPTRGDGVLVVDLEHPIPGVGKGAVLESLGARATSSLELLDKVEGGRYEAVFAVGERRVHARLDTR